MSLLCAPRRMAVWLVVMVALAIAGLLQGCSKPAPWRIGFLSDMSQRTSDAGHEGRNAAQLAVERINAAGGIRGRPIALVAADSGQDAASAQAGAKALVDARVDAIVAAFTSTAATAALPVVNADHLLMVSAMASSTALSGKDDYLVRTDPTTRDSATAYARELAGRGLRNIAVAYDMRNAAYSQSWLSEFREAFEAQGGRIAKAVGFGQVANVPHAQVVAELLTARADAVLFIASAFDTAHLAQRVRRDAPAMPLAASGWAATPTLMELGGKSVEGMLVIRNFNINDSSARYTAFLQQFRQRFGVAPGFTAASVYEAVSVLAQALERAQADESARDAVLRHGPYDGLQQPITFDRFGDTRRTLRFSEVRDGNFAPIP